MDFWGDYPSIKTGWGQLADKTHFIKALNNVGGFLFEIIKIGWMIALFISIIAFLISIATMVIHSDDNPIMKDRAKHDIYAAIMSILLLSFIGMIYSLIISMIAL